MLGLAGLLLLGGTGAGCVRTTSLGRAGGATDGAAMPDRADAGVQGDTRDASSEHDRPAAVDVAPDTVDAFVDMAPIIGGGRDADRDDDGADDATSDGDGPDAI